MRGKSADKHHAAHMGKHASGGRIEDAGGSDYVKHEAEQPEGERENKKRGGKVKAKRARGGKIEGHAAKHHLGRPGRKRGGRVGADLAPLSSASRPAGIGKQAKVQSVEKSPD